MIDGAVVQVQVQELPGVVVLFVGGGHLEAVAEMELRYLYHIYEFFTKYCTNIAKYSPKILTIPNFCELWSIFGAWWCCVTMLGQ